jgi:hypothetical protein
MSGLPKSERKGPTGKGMPVGAAQTFPNPIAPFADALRLQKELLEAYEQASRSWLSRIKSEMELWSKLTSKLTATQTVPEAMEAYQKYVTERMQMAAEDGQRTFNDRRSRKKTARSLSGGWPSASS